jgi:hypothetical protein
MKTQNPSGRKLLITAAAEAAGLGSTSSAPATGSRQSIGGYVTLALRILRAGIRQAARVKDQCRISEGSVKDRAGPPRGTGRRPARRQPLTAPRASSHGLG